MEPAHGKHDLDAAATAAAAQRTRTEDTTTVPGAVRVSMLTVDRVIDEGYVCTFCQVQTRGLPVQPSALLPLLRTQPLAVSSDDDEDDDAMDNDQPRDEDDDIFVSSATHMTCPFCSIECWALWQALRYGEHAPFFLELSRRLPQVRIECLAASRPDLIAKLHARQLHRAQEMARRYPNG